MQVLFFQSGFIISFLFILLIISSAGDEAQEKSLSGSGLSHIIKQDQKNRNRTDYSVNRKKGTDRMQNYETFFGDIQNASKAVKDASGLAVRQQKAIAKNLETGNLTDVRKTLAALLETVSLLKGQTEALQAQVDSFDVQEYFVSGDFTRQLLDQCGEKQIDVKGEKGVYEMFPYKVRVLGDDEHTGEVWLDRKKVQSCRPSFVAETIRAGQARLYAAKFNPVPFMNELAEAYEITCLRAGQRMGSSQPLAKIYKNMVLTAQGRKEYDMQAFAFDLARVYEMGPEAWKSEKFRTSYDFGTSRDGKTGIRVLSRGGTESYISTLNLINTVQE